MNNTDFLNITSKQVKDFFKAQGIAVRVSTVQSVKPHKLIQAWGQNTPEVRRGILLAVHGKIDPTAEQRSYNYGNVQSGYVWMYQSDWLKIFQHFKFQA